MRKLLFSKSQKKHYSHSVVRIGKNNLGFSLVELIIVIAIMAILVAVAIPVLGVFIKRAKIANDKQLVSDILYAIDLANEADAFVGYKQTAIGDIEYPIAFIVIGEEGTKVVTSATKIDYIADSCEFLTVSGRTIEQVTQNATCGTKTENANISKISPNQNYLICETHSPDIVAAVTKLSANTEYTTDYGCNKSGFHLQHSFVETKETLYAETNIIDLSKAYIQSAQNATYCSYAYKNQYGYIDKDSIDVTETDTDHAVYQALVDVFGASFSAELKLSHSEWMDDGNFNYSTLGAYAGNMMQEIEDMCNSSADALNAPISGAAIKSAMNIAGLTFADEYESGADMLNGVANRVVAEDKYSDVDKWTAMWLTVPTQRTYYGFGMNGTEDHAACRKGFNMAFASYLQACGAPDYYVSAVHDYNRMEIGGISIPAVVTFDSFLETPNPTYDGHTYLKTSLESKYNDLSAAEKESVPDVAQALKDIKKYYEQYIASDTYIENAKTFYDTLKTVSETSDVAESSGDYFDYYEGYLKELGKLYSAAQEASKEGNLVIIVSLKDGKAVCTLSNAAADPRND